MSNHLLGSESRKSAASLGKRSEIWDASFQSTEQVFENVKAKQSVLSKKSVKEGDKENQQQQIHKTLTENLKSGKMTEKKVFKDITNLKQEGYETPRHHHHYNTDSKVANKKYLEQTPGSYYEKKRQFQTEIKQTPLGNSEQNTNFYEQFIKDKKTSISLPKHKQQKGISKLLVIIGVLISFILLIEAAPFNNSGTNQNILDITQENDLIANNNNNKDINEIKSRYQKYKQEQQQKLREKQQQESEYKAQQQQKIYDSIQNDSNDDEQAVEPIYVEPIEIASEEQTNNVIEQISGQVYGELKDFLVDHKEILQEELITWLESSYNKITVNALLPGLEKLIREKSEIISSKKNGRKYLSIRRD